MVDYEYTIPRGPVAAMYTGPGPCYRLPGLVGQSGHDPRSLHAKGPAYHFGIRFNEHNSAKDSPGPVYMAPPNVYRNGKAVTPHCVIVSGRTEPKVLITPGPAAYAPKIDVSSSYCSPPAYSIAKARNSPRGKRSRDQTPGPNAYDPDAMMGKTVRSSKKRAPGYSMQSRSMHGSFYDEHSQLTPGPGAYGVTRTDMFKTRSPGYTLVGRHEQTEKMVTPGPGAHNTERTLLAMKKRTPAFSFGIRHSQYAAPGPFLDADKE